MLPPIDMSTQRKNSNASLPPIDSMSSATNIFSAENSTQIAPAAQTSNAKAEQIPPTTYTFPPIQPTTTELTAEEVKFKHKDSILRTENDQLVREIESLTKAVDAAKKSIERLKFERRLLLGSMLSHDQTSTKRAYDESSDDSSIVT